MLRGSDWNEVYNFSNITIPPGEFILIAYCHPKSGFSLPHLIPTLTVDHNIYYQDKIILINTGEVLTLFDNKGAIKDYVDCVSLISNGIKAQNGEGKAIEQCVSLQRLSYSFDINDRAISNISDWTSNLLTPFIHHPESSFDPFEEIGSRDQNYVTVLTPRKEVSELTDSRGGFVSIKEAGVNVDIQYYDGLGRPSQNVKVGASPVADMSLSTYQQYDKRGRQHTSWLPSHSMSNGGYVPIETQRVNTETAYNDDEPYSLTVYEDSPLSRVLEQYGPGDSWHSKGKAIKTTYLTNTDEEKLSCHFFEINENDGTERVSLIDKKKKYTKHEISVIETKDEDGNASYTFKNIFGQTILSRQMNEGIAHDTYYVYDSFGNLCYVLPPILSDKIIDESKSVFDNATEMAQYAYMYKYDARGRCVTKKLPGCDWIYNIYDYADHLTYTQDGEQRERPTKMGNDPKGIWTFMAYDALDRLVLIGESEYPSYNVQKFVCTAYYEPSYAYNMGYRMENLNPNYRNFLTVNYYDNYDFLNRSGFETLNYISKDGYDTRHGNNNDLIATKGLLTGSAVKILDGSDKFIYTAFYYDEKGQLIQTLSTNHIGGIDKEFVAYNFSGQATKRHIEHSGDYRYEIQNEDYAYEYDHVGRLTKTTRNGINIESLSYDYLGQLYSKKQGQSLANTYEYNVRGWMKKHEESKTNFMQELFYQHKPNNSGQGGYNGNISAMTYQQGGDELVQTDYSYDGLNRLTQSTSYTTSGYETASDGNISYDKHGNITYMIRFTNNTTTDGLTMGYQGNQLSSLSNEYSDINGANVVEYPEQNSSFVYNKNGALTSDSGRGIATINYNSLNLAELIQFSNGNQIRYTYSAVGQKLIEQHITIRQGIVQPITTGNVLDLETLPALGIAQRATTYYAGNIIYTITQRNSSIGYSPVKVLFNGGYELYEGGTPKTYYQLKDYLGNIRSTIAEDGQYEVTEYHAFGTPFRRGGSEMSSDPYKFGGKEFDRMHGLNKYDFHARAYDPIFGRFDTMDPLAEGKPWLSPYNYCSNNPILRVDPTGQTDYVYGDGTSYSHVDDGNDVAVCIDALPEVVVTGSAPVSTEKDILDEMYDFGYDLLPMVSYADAADEAWQNGDYWQYSGNMLKGIGDGLFFFGTLGSSTYLKAGLKGSLKLSNSISRLQRSAKIESQGGLNLFKWNAEQTTKTTGWKTGDYILYLPDKGTPKLNWKANYGALRREMKLGNPIYDSYRLSNGNLIPTGGFLNAERSVLQGRGWVYNPNQGAWLPPSP